MKWLGLLMVADEDDVLAETLAANLRYCDEFYVLDGSQPSRNSWRTCHDLGCAGYLTDAALPRPPYPDRPCCGYRKAIHDMAVADHGPDNWFVVLHGDEVWTRDPRELADHPADGHVFPLPFYFPRAGEAWDYTRPPLAQLRWRLGPGYPELRLFRGRAGLGYQPNQFAWAGPHGLHHVVEHPDRPILHYLYRSPGVQIARAERHMRTGFSPGNYQHIADDVRNVYWSDERIAAYQAKPHGYFTELECAPHV